MTSAAGAAPGSVPDDGTETQGWEGGLRLLGVRVQVEPGFLVAVLVLGWVLQQDLRTAAVWVVMATTAVLWHEFGHATALRLYGYTPQVRLHGLGGTTQTAEGTWPAGWRALVTSVAGPAVGFALGGAVLTATLFGPPLPGRWAATAVYHLVWTNIGWGALHLLPVLPLDGGRILATLLGPRRSRRGYAMALVVSLVLSAGVGIAALAAGGRWIPAIVGVLAAGHLAELARLRRNRRVRNAEQDSSAHQGN